VENAKIGRLKNHLLFIGTFFCRKESATKKLSELNFIRTTIVTLDLKRANSLRSDNARFVVVLLTLLAHSVMLG